MTKTEPAHVSDEYPQLFDTEPYELPELPEFKAPAGKVCGQCQHIIAVQFHNTLFFCPKHKGGQYGRKIKKSCEACPLFTQAEGEYIDTRCGRYGVLIDQKKRPKGEANG